MPNAPKHSPLASPSTLPLASRIPLHRLSTLSNFTHQIRCYTSDTKPPPNERAEQEEPAYERLAFQSLTSLFHHSRGGRYSHARLPESNNKQDVPEQAEMPENSQPPEKTSPTEDSVIAKDTTTFFRSLWNAGPESHTTVVDPANSSSSGTTRDESDERQDQLQTVIHPHKSDAAAARQTQGRVRIRRHFNTDSVIHNFKPSGRYSTRRPRVPNPFAPSTQEERRQALLSKSAERTPWGLQSETMDTIDSFSDPSAAAIGLHSKPIQHRVRKSALPGSRSKTIAATPPTLTHLSPSGSARMVDVASKPATKRIAIAHALVRFSNPTPHQLISTSTNAKGDVLSVARIAGIMAAKRTADLIPLCHPLPLTKIDMAVMPYAAGTTATDAPRLWRAEDNDHGVVALTARVECLGPTGVEMEALTAVSAAALTVYDMCKAVDQAIIIDGTKLLYKSGGRRGEYVSTPEVEREWLAKNGLAEK
nr:cyclic pyranopterin monophosphate synthase [Quercus suber]